MCVCSGGGGARRCPSLPAWLLPLFWGPGLGPRAASLTPAPALQGGDPDGLFSEANVLACVLDMVMAGTETTSATLQWAALLMGRHPRVQGGCAAAPARAGPWRAGPRDTGAPSRPQTGCRRSWTGCWGPGGRPGPRTSGRCPTPTPCCMRCRGSSPSCPTCPAARRAPPGSAATCSPRWGPGLGVRWRQGGLGPRSGARWERDGAECRAHAGQPSGGGLPPGAGQAAVPGVRGTGAPAGPAAVPAGHARDPPAELRAAGRDAVGDAPPVQPGALPGRRGALCEAGGLPGLLGGCGFGRGSRAGPRPRPWPDAPASVSPQAAASAWASGWPARSCSCSSPASSRASACSRRPASAPPACAPRPRPPSPCGRPPKPCAPCPGPRGADRGPACALGPGRGRG